MNAELREALELHRRATQQQLEIALAQAELWKQRYLDEVARHRKEKADD